MRQETYIIGMWLMTVALAGNDIDVDGVLMVRGVFNISRTKGKGFLAILPI